MAVEEFYDNTTRADAVVPGTSTSSDAWGYSNVSFTYGISGNLFYPLSTANSVQVFQTISSTDHYIEATISALPSVAHMYLAVRWIPGASDPGACYAIGISPAGVLKTRSYSGGTGSDVTTTIATIVAGDRVGIFIKGSTLSIFRNGGLIHVNSSASVHTSGTKVGIFHDTNSSTERITNLTGGTLLGTYQSPVGSRMAYDRDGTRAFTYEQSSGATVFVERSAGEITELNDEDGTSVMTVANSSFTDKYLSFMFTELRTITGAYVSGSGLSANTSWEYSLDTSDGRNGTWTSITETVGAGSNYRTAAATWVPISSVKGLRHFTSSASSRSYTSVNLYGTPTAAAGVHRLAFWHPYLDIPLPGWYMDIEDLGVNTTKIRSFRLKNISTTLTANTISVTGDDLTTGISVYGQLTFTKASVGAYTSSISITSLASGALSEVLSVKRITTGIQPLGLQAPRINTSITSFT